MTLDIKQSKKINCGTMAVSSLFDSALQAVMRELPSYEPQLSYLPGAVKAKLARVMARRGLLCDRNIMTVSQGEV